MLHSPRQSADDGSALPKLKESYDPCRHSLHATGETRENAADNEVPRVIAQECTPALRRHATAWSATEMPGHAGLGAV